MIFGHDSSFWYAAFGAGVLRVMTSEYEGPWWRWVLKATATLSIAVFVAVVFTKPACAYLGLSLETYGIPMAVLIGVTGENLLRMAMKATGDFQVLFGAIKAWRGK